LAIKFLHAAKGGIAILSSEGELLEHLVSGQSSELSGERERSTWFLKLMCRVAQHSGPLRTTAGDWSDHAIDLSSLQSKVGSLLAIPFHCPSRCRGVLYLGRSEGEPEFTSADQETAQSLCSWIEQGNLLDETRLLAQLQLLNTVAQAAAGNLDLGQILVTSLRELDRHLPLHVTAIWLVENDPAQNSEKTESPISGNSLFSKGAFEPSRDSLVLANMSAAFVERARHKGLSIGHRLEPHISPFATSLKDGQPLFADRPPAEPGTGSGKNLSRADLALYLAESSAASCFAVPLRAGDRIVGILHSVCTRPSGFIVEQIQLLYLVADLIGPAISNCQLFAHLSGAYEELRRTQVQLIQAEKMRALGELASGMAHEFNNSLCGVLGFLELALLNPALESGTRTHLESGRVCALDAAQVVRRVQDFSRKRKGEGVQPIELNDFVKQTIELIRHKWESLDRARGTPIEVEVETGKPALITANPAEMREVLTNLVFNAVDAMPRGGKLSLRTWGTKDEAYLTVQDTGVGMSEAVRQRLFEPFFTTKGERGNGLGLSVVFGIVQRHGGHIKVDSEPGKGTLFTVSLPLGAPTGHIANAPKKPTPDQATSGKSLRILVVEDEESIRRFLNSGLTSMGHRPRITSDAEEALTIFSEDDFDLVLTDLGLPGVSGEEVARVVSHKAPGLPIILLTGWADQLQAESHSLEGVTRILSKPISLDTLAATLRVVTSTPVGV
jgi:signal transduction histidine kinase